MDDPSSSLTPDPPLFDLVAVAYRAPLETGRFFESLQGVEAPFTLTVVNNDIENSSTSRLVEQWQERASAIPTCVGTSLIKWPHNPGYARACNEGAAYGDAPYLALLNCDIQFFPGVLTQIAGHFNEHADVGVIGPRTRTSDGRLTHAGIIEQRGRDQHRFWLAPDQGQAHDIIDVPTVSGATYFVRRQMWEELTACPNYQEVAPLALGAFLPTQHFFEETWCSYHAWAHGWKVRYLGTTTMIHEWHRSSSPGAPESSGKFQESREYFLRACRAHGIEGRA